ncbi:DUF6415 family natural product biosynthesis protein [Streptomyces nigra]|uniref:DUF6415 family natural product biosynthesis protein n=1 Tax=Streptomyces nigra TaxID=1827580 RepID=UPI0037FBA6AD
MTDTTTKAMPVDVATIRDTTSTLLGPDPQLDDLDTLVLALRGHIQLLIPEVEALAAAQPKDTPERFCALACIGEAQRKLRLGDGQTPPTRIAVAQKLARVVNALCDHYEKLQRPAC